MARPRTPGRCDRCGAFHGRTRRLCNPCRDALRPFGPAYDRTTFSGVLDREHLLRWHAHYAPIFERQGRPLPPAEEFVRSHLERKPVRRLPPR